MTKIKTIPRSRNNTIYEKLLAENYPALVANIVSSRINGAQGDIDVHKIISPALSTIFPPALLANMPCATDRIVSAIKNKEPIGLVSDYDCDGITSHVVLYESLVKIFGVSPGSVQCYIGNQISDGYGLSEHLASRILQAERRPQVIITSDCGSSDETNILTLKNAGIDVIVTDHHIIPSAGIPISAFAVVNPLRDDCPYPDKSIAGVTVAWFLMCHVRRCLIDAGLIDDIPLTMTSLLDFVALGTVADSVSLLAPSNRAIVKAGLVKMNTSDRPCWIVLRNLLSRNGYSFNAQDLAFQIAPRINARGRISDPFAAFQYLTTDNLADAERLLKQLDDDNRQRKIIEKSMFQMASSFLDGHITPEVPAIVIGHSKFHAGVQGIVASRLVEKYGRPVIVLSPVPGDDVKLTGSARTVDGVDLHKALQNIHLSNPTILEAFGGHKGAAGMTLPKSMVPEFRRAFSEAVQSQIGDKKCLDLVLFTDGDLNELLDDALEQIKSLEPYGAGFEEPIFSGRFKVSSVRTVGAGDSHLSMVLGGKNGKEYHGIWFRRKSYPGDPAPIGEGSTIDCVFSLGENAFRGDGSLQIFLKGLLQ